MDFLGAGAVFAQKPYPDGLSVKGEWSDPFAFYFGNNG